MKKYTVEMHMTGVEKREFSTDIIEMAFECYRQWKKEVRGYYRLLKYLQVVDNSTSEVIEFYK